MTTKNSKRVQLLGSKFVQKVPRKVQLILLLVLFVMIGGGISVIFRWISAKPCQTPEDDLKGFRPFRPTDPWNTVASVAPVDPDSDAILKTIGLDLTIHPDFGSSFRLRPHGIPYNLVNQMTRRFPVDFDYESDNVDYPIPDNPRIEGGESSTGDRHIIMVDRDEGKLYELFDAYREPDGTWKAGSGAIFDLRYNTKRPQGWTSADAAGLPIFPGLVRYDEVAQGEIAHALRFTVRKTRAAYVPPATHKASRITEPNFPPMGMRVRLKASVFIDDLPPQARVIARSLKTYGMLLADNGGSWFISGTPDRRWDDHDIASLKRLRGRDFEVVKLGWTGDTWEEDHDRILKGFFSNADRIAKDIVRAEAGLPIVGQSRVTWIDKLIQINNNQDLTKILEEMKGYIEKGGDIANVMERYPLWFDKEIVAGFHDAEMKGDLSIGIKVGVEHYGKK